MKEIVLKETQIVEVKKKIVNVIHNFPVGYVNAIKLGLVEECPICKEDILKTERLDDNRHPLLHKFCSVVELSDQQTRFVHTHCYQHLS